MYVKSTERDGAYEVFTTNRDVPVDRVSGFVIQYRLRWWVENEYKAIKKHFHPTVGSTGLPRQVPVLRLRRRAVQRLTGNESAVSRDVADEVHLGEHPSVKAGEVKEIFVFCLVDPG